MDRYITPGCMQNTEPGKSTGRNNADAAAIADLEFPPLNINTYPPEGFNLQSWE
jgi:hypothetical protein